MAFRVNEADVAEIIDTEKDIKGYLKTANIVINNTFADDTTVDDVTLAELERWLCAHFIESDTGTIVSQKIDDSVDKFADHLGKGFDSTRFGMQLKLIDPSGLLAALDTNHAAITFWSL